MKINDNVHILLLLIYFITTNLTYIMTMCNSYVEKVSVHFHVLQNLF